MAAEDFHDLQAEAIGALLMARLNRGTTEGEYEYCRCALVGPLAVAPPLTRHPFVEVFREGELFVQSAANMKVTRQVQMTVRYFLGPKPRDALPKSFPMLSTLLGRMLGAIKRKHDTAWHNTPTPPAPVVYYTLAEHGAVGSIRPVRCSYAYMEAGDGPANVHPGLLMTLEVTHQLLDYSTDVELLTRANVNLNLDGAVEGESGYQMGRIVAVTGTETP